MTGGGAAQAYLGGFEYEDGYYWGSGTSDPGGEQWQAGASHPGGLSGAYWPRDNGTYGDGGHGPDIASFNAGSYGTNINTGDSAGAYTIGTGAANGSPSNIGDNTGLWNVHSGGLLGVPGNTGSPNGPYPSTSYYNYAVAAPGGHSGTGLLDIYGGHANTNSNTDDLSYSYTLDSRDLDGTSPTALTGNEIISVDFYFCPNHSMAQGVSNQHGHNRLFTMDFSDSLKATGFAIGYDWDHNMIYQDASGWVTTNEKVGQDFINGIDYSYPWTFAHIEIDLANDKFRFGISKNFLGEDSARGIPAEWDADGIGDIWLTGAGGAWVDLAADMGDLSRLGLWQDRGTSKNFLDDFNFQVTPVPEPSAMLLSLIAPLFLMLRRRR